MNFDNMKFGDLNFNQKCLISFLLVSKDKELIIEFILKSEFYEDYLDFYKEIVNKSIIYITNVSNEFKIYIIKSFDSSLIKEINKNYKLPFVISNERFISNLYKILEII